MTNMGFLNKQSNENLRQATNNITIIVTVQFPNMQGEFDH